MALPRTREPNLNDLAGMETILRRRQPLFDPSKRFVLFEDFRKLPGTTTELDPADFGTQAKIRAYTLGNKDWMLSGTNAVVGSCTRRAGGGLTLTTAGADDDQVILSPLVVNSVQQSAFGQVSWVPESGPAMEVGLVLGASVAAVRLVAGLKLTAVLAEATDDDQAMFVYDPEHASSAGYWHAVTSRDGTDTNAAVDTTKYNAAPVASRRLTLTIQIDKDTRKPLFFIDHRLVYTGAALVAAEAFKPVIGVQALTGAAKVVSPLYCMMSKNYS